jgi:hypothetical protein
MTDDSLEYLRERIKTLEAQVARTSTAEDLAARLERRIAESQAEIRDWLDQLVPSIRHAIAGNKQAIAALSRIAEHNALLIPDEPPWERCDA